MGIMEIDDVKERAVPKKIYENRLEKRNNFICNNILEYEVNDNFYLFAHFFFRRSTF